ncbi:MAG: hypothetical protein NTV23_02340 [Propionibacteriales bacterium]|nr:hypothetical protein [Propionibacteriales bacterium]
MPFTDRPRLGLAVLGVCATLAVGACGARDNDPVAAEPGTAPTSTASGPAASASSTPSTSAATAAPTAASPSPEALLDRLLDTRSVPGLNATWRWQDGETGRAGSEPFGLCAKADLASIGAGEVVQRTYFPPVDTDDNAAEQVTEFPDGTTTAGALAVLKSWQKKCTAHLGRPGAKVGPITPVPVGTGSFWYLVSYPEGNDEGRFHAFGVAVVGNRMAALTIDNGGQDYNYPSGQEPMVAMVRAAAARLG